MDSPITLSARKVKAVDYLTAAFDLAADGTEKGKASIQEVEGILVIARPATVKALAQSIGKPGPKDPRIPKLDLPNSPATEVIDAVRKASNLKDKTDWDALAKVGLAKDREIRKISLGSVRLKTALILIAESMSDDDVTVESHMEAESFWFTAKPAKKAQAEAGAVVLDCTLSLRQRICDFRSARHHAAYQTGRKIIVDSYGGGAFSGKDPSKVDRSACCMGRYIAKNIVASGCDSAA